MKYSNWKFPGEDGLPIDNREFEAIVNHCDPNTPLNYLRSGDMLLLKGEGDWAASVNSLADIQFYRYVNKVDEVDELGAQCNEELPEETLEFEFVFQKRGSDWVVSGRHVDEVDELDKACNEELFNIARSCGAKLNNMNALLSSVVDEVNQLKAGVARNAVHIKNAMTGLNVFDKRIEKLETKPDTQPVESLALTELLDMVNDVRGHILAIIEGRGANGGA